MKLSRPYFERSPEEAARQICLGLLGEATEAYVQLERGEDKEALHDFRVALRRLRSVMRAFRSHLRGSVGKKLRQELKSLAASTNSARDLEVQLEWLNQESSSSTWEESEREAAAILRGRLESSRSHRPAEPLGERFRSLRRALIRRLTIARIDLQKDTPYFALAIGRLLGKGARTLRESLTRAATTDGEEELHRARIRAKELRYLLEPLRGELPGATPLIQRLKLLQDCLGEIQDARVLTATISTALEGSALEQVRRLQQRALSPAPTASEEGDTGPDPSPGLLSLMRRQQERRTRRYLELESDWLREGGEDFFRDLDTLAQQLASWFRGSQRRRGFLLKALPASLASARGERIDEGWLPGKKVRESIQRRRLGRRVLYRRCVEQANGGNLEEKLTRRDFDLFWPLTEGRRLTKRQFRIEDEGVWWTIDELTDEGLILARCEGDPGALPDWLNEELAREVTGQARYQPRALAAIAGRRSRSDQSESGS